MLRIARNRWNIKGFCLSNAESNADSDARTNAGFDAGGGDGPERSPVGFLDETGNEAARASIGDLDAESGHEGDGPRPSALQSPRSDRPHRVSRFVAAGRALFPIIRGNAAWQQPGIRLAHVPCIARGDGGSGKGMSLAVLALGSVPRIPGKPLYGEEAR